MVIVTGVRNVFNARTVFVHSHRGVPIISRDRSRGFPPTPSSVSVATIAVVTCVVVVVPDREISRDGHANPSVDIADAK